MSIPFPKIHIATSVLNRIMNAIEGEEALSMTDMTPPLPPNPVAEGLELDEKLATPPEPIAAPPGTEPDVEASMVESSALGGSPFDGALVGAGGPQAPSYGMF